jgi:hypothetical protein
VPTHEALRTSTPLWTPIRKVSSFGAVICG